MATYKDWLALPGVWALIWKDATSHAPLIMIVGPGDKPFYSAQHIGLTGSGGSNEIIAYGIGKVDPAGVRTSLWSLPGGLTCAGDDVFQFGTQMVRAMGPAR